MRHRVESKRVNRPKDHRNLMLRNLATSVLLYEKVKTTEAKAKALRPVLERLIHQTKSLGNAAAYRQLNAYLLDKNASKKFMAELKNRYKDRSSGYVRITPLGIRHGDAAPVVQIALV